MPWAGIVPRKEDGDAMGWNIARDLARAEKVFISWWRGLHISASAVALKCPLGCNSAQTIWVPRGA